MALNSGRLGIARDRTGWWKRFVESAEALHLDHEVFEIERADWLDLVQGFDGVLWRPNLDRPFCEEAKEKIYFIEHVMRKRIFPNWATFWHYDNKRAQAYLFEVDGIPSPKTFCSYAWRDARDFVRMADFPLVSKSAGGALSESVHLLVNARQAQREVRRVFRESFTGKALRRCGVLLCLHPDTMRNYVLWQEYIPGNRRDLRVAIIGQRHAFVFWRNNRPGDFRASGSGSIDYEVQDGRPEIQLCLGICRARGLDSMAFDIVYRETQPVVLEMSYAFNDKAIFDAPGHFIVTEDDELEYQPGHVWPQHLVMEYVTKCLYGDDPTR